MCDQRAGLRDQIQAAIEMQAAETDEAKLIVAAVSLILEPYMPHLVVDGCEECLAARQFERHGQAAIGELIVNHAPLSFLTTNVHRKCNGFRLVTRPTTGAYCRYGDAHNPSPNNPANE